MSKRKKPSTTTKKTRVTKKTKVEVIEDEVGEDEVEETGNLSSIVIDPEAQSELINTLSFDPTQLSSRDDFGSTFKSIADTVMNNYLLMINGKPYRLGEIEFYFCGDKHPDVFTHQDENQQTRGKWYFHRAGKGYKGGNYKGLDFTFGSENGCFGGVLIRSIVDYENGDYIEGSCNVVNQILSLNKTKKGIPEIIDFVGFSDFDLSIEKKSRLFLKADNTLPKLDVYSSFRVGLTLKKKDGERTYYIMKPYRFITHPEQVRKGRPNLVLTLHGEGKSIDEIVNITGCGKGTVQKYVNMYNETDENYTIDNFVGKNLSTDDLCRLYKLVNV